MLGDTFICYPQHSDGGASEIRFSTTPGDGPAAAALPTTAEIAAALDTLFQSKGYLPLYVFGTDTEQVQVYPAPETGA